MLRRFLSNHVLANLAFVLVLVLGFMAYNDMPRARDPDINFNWINISTVLPGASSLEVEKRITDPIEDTISRTVKDLRFVSSTSREGISSILVRFNQLDEREFDKRVADLRREVQNVYTDQLPDEANDPYIIEITSSSGFPTAMIALTSESFDDDFRRYATTVKKEFERINGIDQATLSGVEDPELHIAFYPERLEGLGITPADLADTVRGYFQDVSVGDIETDNSKWIVRLEGTSGSLEDLEAFPVVGTEGVVPLGNLVDVYRSAAEPRILTRYNGKPAIMISITKQEGVNILEILDRIRQFVDVQNQTISTSGYRMELIDDQTVSTREAISLMQNNALIGLLFVVLVTYLFLGGHISFLTSIGIPFTLAGTFLVLNILGMSVNNSVLLGIVIALGMLVDDAVVVVEAIYYRLQRGADAMTASIEALQEVFAPVLTSVMTTIAVFLPLMLLPGILGEFMRVIPIVVCVGLAISLFEAFWMLPAHVAVLKLNYNHENRLQRLRRLSTRRLRHQYSIILIKAMRHPQVSFISSILVLVVAVALLASGAIKFNFFAADPLRLFYVNAEMPQGSALDKTLKLTTELEQLALEAIEPQELRASLSYSGQMFTATEPLFGDNFGQVFISLQPSGDDIRSVPEIIAAVEEKVGTRFKEADVSVLLISDGPPVGQPISVKVRGSSFDGIQAVVNKLEAFMREQGLYNNINIDFKPGNPEMTLSLNGDAIKRAGLTPTVVTRSLQSYVDGELVSQYQYLGEEVDVRLLAKTQNTDVGALLQQTIVDQNNSPITLNELVNVKYGYGYQNIRHYNFQRAVTVAADIDETQTDTVAANDLLRSYWESIRDQHPSISLDYSGELDDIQESLDGMAMLFLMGLGLIYLILGTQFGSYFQPLIVMVSVPLAFAGVVFGLVITSNPLSLMTMYGIVALSGISVNAAIVLISAANARIESGMSVLHATIFAARRRVVPILITSMTTVAGLFSLAAGFAGQSLVWGPVATAIVSGLIFSTVLILIIIPLLYRATAKWRMRDFFKHVLANLKKHLLRSA